MKEVVHVETQEQYDYVLSKIENKKNLDDLHYTAYNCNTCINLYTECYGSFEYYTEEGYKIISFEEFKSRYEPNLNIGDTFEYNGFVCEVKEEIKKWYKSENAYVRTEPMKAEGWTEITNKEFIKQLEENVR